MEAFMTLHSKEIERFALQCGFKGDKAAGVAEDTCRIFQRQLATTETEQNLTRFYKVAFELMQEIWLEDLQVEVFPFKEDTVLHSTIIRLASETRVPFILSVFHQFDMIDIAVVMTCTLAEVEERLQTARTFLGREIGEERLDRRLKLLGKSYNRLSLQFNNDHVLGVERPLTEPMVKIQKKKSLKGLITAVVFGVLLVGLIGGTYFNDVGSNLGSDERYIEKIKSGFKKEKNKKIKLLGGISNEVFNEISFVEEAEHQYSNLIQRLENKVESEKVVNRNVANEEYAEVIELLKLPSELVVDLLANPLVEDVDSSIDFMNLYIDKLNMLSYPLSIGVSIELEKYIETTGFENFDMEAFLAKEEEFDVKARSSLNALKSQNMLVLPYFMTEEKHPDPSYTQLIASIRKALNESAHIYLTVYEKEPFFMDEQLVYSLEETSELIEEMDVALQDRYKKGYSAPTIEEKMPGLLEAIVAGKTKERLRDEDGTISEVFRGVWRKLASLGPNSGVGMMMSRVVSEMEETGWTQSEFHEAIAGYKIYEAYQLAIEGNLDVFQIDEEVQFEEKYNEHITDYVSLKDETRALYELFSVAHDKAALESIQPLVILSLYYYANELADPLTMWQLTDEESRLPSAEEYVRNWTMKRSLFEDAESIHFDPGLLMGTDVQPLVPIEFQENGNRSYAAWMTYESGEVWKVQRIVDGD